MFSSTSASVFISVSSPAHTLTLVYTYYSSILVTFPYHFDLRPCNLIDICFHVRFPCNYFVPCSLPIYYSTDASILTSQCPPHPTSSIALYSPLCLSPYIIAGLTTVLYMFPMTFKVMFLSYIPLAVYILLFDYSYV